MKKKPSYFSRKMTKKDSFRGKFDKIFIFSKNAKVLQYRMLIYNAAMRAKSIETLWYRLILLRLAHYKGQSFTS